MDLQWLERISERGTNRSGCESRGHCLKLAINTSIILRPFLRVLPCCACIVATCIIQFMYIMKLRGRVLALASPPQVSQVPLGLSCHCHTAHIYLATRIWRLSRPYPTRFLPSRGPPPFSVIYVPRAARFPHFHFLCMTSFHSSQAGEDTSLCPLGVHI